MSGEESSLEALCTQDNVRIDGFKLEVGGEGG